MGETMDTMDRAYSRAWALLRLLDLLEGVAEVLGVAEVPGVAEVVGVAEVLWVVEVEEGLGDSKDMRSKAPAAVVEEEGAIGIRETWGRFTGISWDSKDL